MSRPSVLVVDPETSRRKELAHGLTEFGYEVIPAIDEAPVRADRLRGLLARTFRFSELIVAEMGPGVGTHAGPGTVGTALFQPIDDELPLVAPLSETM